VDTKKPFYPISFFYCHFSGKIRQWIAAALNSDSACIPTHTTMKSKQIIRFTKYHALGNDYLVLDPEDCENIPEAGDIIRICHRNLGLGSDGILYGPLAVEDSSSTFGLRIYNPDGSEAEKSGNGLRIFSRYLFDCGKVQNAPFRIWTKGGQVESRVFEDGEKVSVEMGKVSFQSADIPVSGPEREVIRETLDIDGSTYTFCAATIGNPHAVFPMEEISEENIRLLGPKVETHPLFPNRTNVQLMRVMSRSEIAIQIWERGAGYTLASGSSSCACAAVARKLDLVDPALTVHCPGGDLQIQVSDEFRILMTGPVTRVGTLSLDVEALA